MSGSHPSAREFRVTYHSRIGSLASVTGRVGYAWDRFLGYVKGGGAWERDSYAATTLILGTAYRANDTRSGWTNGGGEYAITKFLSGFVEHDYYDFGTNTTRLTPQVPGLRPGFVDIEERANVVRAGLNVRFGG
jgi:outer membrane immunogenic protein